MADGASTPTWPVRSRGVSTAPRRRPAQHADHRPPGRRGPGHPGPAGHDGPV